MEQNQKTALKTTVSESGKTILLNNGGEVSIIPVNFITSALQQLCPQQTNQTQQSTSSHPSITLSLLKKNSYLAGEIRLADEFLVLAQNLMPKNEFEEKNILMWWENPDLRFNLSVVKIILEPLKQKIEQETNPEEKKNLQKEYKRFYDKARSIAQDPSYHRTNLKL